MEKQLFTRLALSALLVSSFALQANDANKKETTTWMDTIKSFVTNPFVVGGGVYAAGKAGSQTVKTEEPTVKAETTTTAATTPLVATPAVKAPAVTPVVKERAIWNPFLRNFEADLKASQHEQFLDKAMGTPSTKYYGQKTLENAYTSGKVAANSAVTATAAAIASGLKYAGAETVAKGVENNPVCTASALAATAGLVGYLGYKWYTGDSLSKFKVHSVDTLDKAGRALFMFREQLHEAYLVAFAELKNGRDGQAMKSAEDIFGKLVVADTISKDVVEGQLNRVKNLYTNTKSAIEQWQKDGKNGKAPNRTDFYFEYGYTGDKSKTSVVAILTQLTNDIATVILAKPTTPTVTPSKEDGKPATWSLFNPKTWFNSSTSTAKPAEVTKPEVTKPEVASKTAAVKAKVDEAKANAKANIPAPKEELPKEETTEAKPTTWLATSGATAQLLGAASAIAYMIANK